MAEQGSKAGRREKHQARAKAQKERKKLRKQRADIHRAMTESARLKRTKKKGCADLEQNMVNLGYRPLTNGRDFGREISGDVLQKYEMVKS
jgi:hypothetical protein